MTPPIHMLKSVTREQGDRVIETRCGQTVHESFSDPLRAGTGWEDYVTCEECKL